MGGHAIDRARFQVTGTKTGLAQGFIGSWLSEQLIAIVIEEAEHGSSCFASEAYQRETDSAEAIQAQRFPTYRNDYRHEHHRQSKGAGGGQQPSN